MSELDPRRIAAELTTRALGRSLELKRTTGSTNDDARRAASLGAAHGHVIVSDTQTQGRGSRGRAWLSPAGTDLYLSIVAELPLAPAELPPLTLAVGLAAAEAIDALLAPGRALVKWPNDVWIGRKKAVGVLVESASLGEHLEPLVIGLGINVNRTQFPAELHGLATSLALEAGAEFERARVLAELLNRLEAWLDRFVEQGPAPVVEAISRRLALRGERVVCDDVTGIVEGVAASGALLMRTDAGLRTLSSGTLRACDEPSLAPA